MKKFFLLTLAITALLFASCGDATQSNELQSASENVTRDDELVFGAKEAPSGTEIQAEGFGRCLERGCYCKAFKGRGQTCQNCGHAYRRHY